MEMKSNRILKNGKRQVTVIIETNEQLVAIDNDLYYRMGEPFDDVLAGFILVDAVPVVWDSLSQKWME
jgi:hypothetical protein